MSVPYEHMQIEPNLKAHLERVRARAALASEAPYTPHTGKRFAEHTRAAHKAAEKIEAAEAYMPYLQAAAQLSAPSRPFPEVAGNYMNPYQERVVNRIAELGNRNLTENILPALEAKFVRLGQHGGKRHAQLSRQAARDIQSEISSQQAQAMERGYTQASDIYNAEQIRKLEAARMQAALGQAVQAGKLSDVEALQMLDAKMRELEQQKLDFDYQEFLKTREHPYDMISFYNAMLAGHPYSRMTQSYTPSAPKSMHRSDFQRMGLGLGINSLGSMFGRTALGNLFGFKKGGHVKGRR